MGISPYAGSNPARPTTMESSSDGQSNVKYLGNFSCKLLQDKKMDLNELLRQEESKNALPLEFSNVWYNKTGDILEILFRNTEYYAEWKSPKITLLRSQETDEIVGVQIWDILHIIKGTLWQ